VPDRIEREIEEILEKLGEPPAATAGSPPREPTPIKRRPAARRGSLRIDLPNLMFLGAGIMVAGLLVANVAGDAFIWLAMAGVGTFLAAFVISFVRGWPRPAGRQATPGSAGGYWRGQYVAYDAPSQGRGVRERLRRLLRR
jgi:hypothetical protein